MLSAYFDDSGTHGQSEVVIVAGIMGTESELLSLEGVWREHLENPLGGLRSPVREFHASHCFSSSGEFEAWNRTETDFFRHQLREVIVHSHVSGFGFACVRQEFDSEIQGDIRSILGDSEAFATTNCIVRALRWARIATFDHEISFVFDNKPERNQETKAIFDAFQMHTIDRNIAEVSFLNSQKICALQGADLFSWEYYQYAQQILKYGIETPAIDGMRHLAKNIYYIDGQIARADALRKVKENWTMGDQDLFRASADYFAKFRPASATGSVGRPRRG